MEFNHYSVLLNETIENLNIKPDGIYVDGTLGGGGDETDAGDGVLTTAGTLVDNGVLSHL